MANAMRNVSATIKRLARQRSDARDSIMYNGAFRWMVPLALALITIVNVIAILCGLILTANAEILDEPSYNVKAYVHIWPVQLPLLLVTMD